MSFFQAGGYSSEEGIVSREMIMEKVEDSRVAHRQKMAWLSDEENRENRQVGYRHPQQHAAPPGPVTASVQQLGFTARTFS